MVAELYTVTFASGIVAPSGNHAVCMSLLCGVSGTTVIPMRVDETGKLLTASGA